SPLLASLPGPTTHRLLRHFQPAAHLCLTQTLLPQIQRCKPPLFHGRKIPSCRSSFRHKEKTLLGSLTLRYIMQMSIGRLFSKNPYSILFHRTVGQTVMHVHEMGISGDSGGKANGFRPIPEWLSRCPECFFGGAAALDIIPAQ